ncbi:MAG TPA: hypothetical protein VM008_10930 [Phycisphaerae bacterium]|nr:hypothetical protein [Phycisphaerae bacterium]
MSTPAPQGVVLLLGPAHSRYPEPLATAIELGDFEFHRAASVHEAAAALSALRSHNPILILDPAILTRADVDMLQVIKRHLATPMVFLPMTPAASPAVRQAVNLALNWDAANKFFTEDRNNAAAHPQPDSRTDNIEAASAETLLENSITSAINPRYDEQQPVLTEEEMRALLGTLD